MRREHTIAVLLAGVLGAVAGCGPALVDGSGSSPSSSPPMDLHGAPHVQHPLAIDRFKSNPCSVLTEDQVRQLQASVNFPAHDEIDNTPNVSRACYWSNGGVGTSVSVDFLEGGHGLSSVYAQRGEAATFQPLPPIDGYPVVHESASKEFNDCTLTVGVSDRQAVTVQYGQGSGGPGLCDSARKVAIEVVHTIESANH